MIFGQDRQRIRQTFHDAWRKAQTGSELEPLESLIVDVIEDHPEYHGLVTRDVAPSDLGTYPEHGQSNPYLHMGMHLALREQVATDRPAGIAALTRGMLLRWRDSHEMEHRMMDCLGDALAGGGDDERAYFECLQRLATQTR